MKRLRLWILGAALGSFLAGMNVGLAAPRLFADPEPTPDDDYVHSMVADYGLSTEQHRLLRFAMLKWREEELALIKTVEADQLPAVIQGRLLQARGKMERRIFAILDEEQRERYDLATRHDPTGNPTGPTGR